jgi:hypothetical protein
MKTLRRFTRNRFFSHARITAAVILITAAAAIAFVAASPRAAAVARIRPLRPLCQDNSPLCTEVFDSLNYDGKYTGHDEPSLLFYSNRAGSGNSSLYRLTLPKDPPNRPVQTGTGGTFNFQLHPAFWFGMAMCDDQSAPNPGGSTFAGPNIPCTPDSDANIYTSTTTTDPNYIGKHPGAAFMEMQFYPPGWVLWPAGNSCDPTKWCAALNVDSFSQNSNAGQNNNAACLDSVGIEPVNFAFITKNGVAHAPANPVDATLATFTPNPTTDLFMESGDELIVDLHDTPDGFEVVIHDLTRGTSGSMKASVANGFGQVNYDPSATTCTVTHAPFHPMYATSSENTRVVWAAHSYNIAFSDEIGHFEYCNAVDGQGGNCIQDGVHDTDATFFGDEDDVGCFAPPFMPPFQSTRVKVGGCLGTDVDFDGVPYQPVWPGSGSSADQDAAFHPTSILFTSPLFNGSHNYSRVAFEVNLPRIEGDTIPVCQRHFSNPADPSPGTGCVNPPVGANFYPFYSTGFARRHHDGAVVSEGEESEGQCVWQLGGANIPGTAKTFGGSSTAEFGPLLLLAYPVQGGVSNRFNNFRNVLSSNPCPSANRD